MLKAIVLHLRCVLMLKRATGSDESDPSNLYSSALPDERPSATRESSVFDQSKAVKLLTFSRRAIGLYRMPCLFKDPASYRVRAFPATSASKKRARSGVERGDQRIAASIETEEVACRTPTYRRFMDQSGCFRLQ